MTDAPPPLNPHKRPVHGKRRAPKAKPKVETSVLLPAALIVAGLVFSSTQADQWLDTTAAQSVAASPTSDKEIEEVVYNNAPAPQLSDPHLALLESGMTLRALDEQHRRQQVVEQKKAAQDLVEAKKKAQQKKIEARKKRQRLQKQKRERQQRIEARQIANTPLQTVGPAGTISALTNQVADISTSLAVANIPNRTGDAGWVSSMNTLTSNKPDFIVLNEVSRHSTESINAVAPAYTVHRAPGPDSSPGGSQILNNVVLARSETWQTQASGIVRVVNDDRGYRQGQPFIWDRFATWAVLRRADGAVTSVVSVHMPTNPEKYPAQHGNPALSRAELYGQGMTQLIELEKQLANYGPVVIAGDMNSHPGQGPWAAVPKMTAAGYRYVKDSGVMYIFHKNAIIRSNRQVPVVSDHPALVTELTLN